MRALPRLDADLLRRMRVGFVADLPRMLLVGALLALVVAAGQFPAIRRWWALDEFTVTLALVSVAIGVVSAISCGVLGQLADDARGLWMCVAIITYSTIAIPAATLNATGMYSDAVVGNVRLLAHTMLAVLSFAAVFAARRPAWDGWGVLSLNLLLTAAVIGLGVLLPGASLAVTTNQVVRYAVCAVWVLSGVSLVLASWLRRPSWLFWVGMGCTVIAIAHTLRVTAGSPDMPLGLSFSTMRLFGVVLLLVGTGMMTRRALLDIQEAHSGYEEELRLARMDLERIEQCAHDVRNGLVGLAGVTSLLDSGGRDAKEMADLRAAVVTELARLDGLLRPRAADGTAFVPRDFEVEPVLAQLVTLYRTSGLDLREDVQHGLRATGGPSVLSQVMTNVLANCAQHAPGSPVRIQARRLRGRVQILVRDFGPGVPPGAEDAVFDMGARGERSTGQGLGLHICRGLLAMEGGTIDIKPARSRRSGCTVLIQLPAAQGLSGRANVLEFTKAG